MKTYDTERIQRELAKRMSGQQRYRLLQGFPMVPLMNKVKPGKDLPKHNFDPDLELIVGVIPHPFCNPTVAGCGFCTFPHQKFEAKLADLCLAAVVNEIRQRSQDEQLAGRKVSAVYFGGGTANLINPMQILRLTNELGSTFDLSEAEVTLEGVPSYFANRNCVGAFSTISCQSKRISMGVQTFDQGWLERMGRQHFGDFDLVLELVRQIHTKRNMTASGDFMINLPGQESLAMLEDIQRAIQIGFDQICVYNLVLKKGYDAAWTKDPAMFIGLDDNDQRLANWLAVRQLLLDSGYVQTTVTNFERAELVGTRQHFRYEELSYSSFGVNGIGFGPAAISISTDIKNQTGLKTINHNMAADYVASRLYGTTPWERFYRFTKGDQRVAYLTRCISSGSMPRGDYYQAFRTGLVKDFALFWTLMAEAGLIEIRPKEIRLTPKGSYFADTVGGLLAWPRISELLRNRETLITDDNAYGGVAM